MKREDAVKDAENPAVLDTPSNVAIDPRLSPSARKEAQAIIQRTQQRRHHMPAAGFAPPQPIPRLDGAGATNMTAAQNALEQRMGTPPGASIIAPAPPQHVAPQGPRHQLLHTDVLPENAKSDPAFRDGMGSQMASSQPALAYKYGVVRNGVFVSPTQLSGKSTLKEETLEGLRAVKEFSEQIKNVNEDVDTKNATEAAAQGMGGNAARMANAMGNNDVSPVDEKQRQVFTSSLQQMDEFDLNQLREMQMKDILNNQEQRKEIEERLVPMDITDLIVHNEVRQVIPIQPGKYEITLRSLSGEEELALRRLLIAERKNLDVADQYLLDKMALMTLAASLVRINTVDFPSMHDKSMVFDDSMFWTKFNRVCKLPFAMLASMCVHYFWFETRVRKLHSVSLIKKA